MAERKSVNKYYPPDWDPSKGSVNNYVGQHPLRDRAKKLSQGILVIRFEMPYNIWCGGCNAHIGMGVRYNAEKSKTGNYYSTPIYKFRMKCHLCDNYFEIQTDPKNHDYVILEGARRKEQRWDPKENEQIVPEDKATQKKLATDPMFKLEHGTDDKQRGKKAVSNLALLEVSKEGMKDDYILNKIARNKFREEKKSLKKIQEDDAALLKRSSLDIPLLKEKDEDVKLAGLIRLRAVDTYDEKQAQKRKEIVVRPIFQSKKRSRDDDDEDEGQPQSKRLKIIRDNISKAKVNSSTNPFDRIKTNKIGNGLTKNQLGIRLKNTESRKSLTGINNCVDDHPPSNECITNLDEAKTTLKVPLMGEGNNSNSDDSKSGKDKNATESDNIDDVTCSFSDRIRKVTNVLPDKSTKDACITDDKKSDHSKHSVDSTGDLICSQALDNCIGMNRKAGCNEDFEQSCKTCSEPFKTVRESNCSNMDGNQPEDSSERIQHTEVIFDRSTEGISISTEKSDTLVKNEEPVCPELLNAEVQSAIPGQRRSLVAEYSDSEDTD